jgi:cytochrome P450 family 4
MFVNEKGQFYIFELLINFDLFIIGGQTVRKGTSLSIFIYAIHHDGTVFPDPEKFDPERFAENSLISDERSPFAFIPFSAGSRNCIGK